MYFVGPLAAALVIAAAVGPGIVVITVATGVVIAAVDVVVAAAIVVVAAAVVSEAAYGIAIGFPLLETFDFPLSR